MMTGKRGINIMCNAYAAALDQVSDELYMQKAGGDPSIAKKMEDEDRAIHESFRIPAKFGKEGQKIIVDLGLNFEATAPGGAIISPHGYRATPYIKRTDEQNKENISIVSNIVGALAEEKRPDSKLAMNWGSYGEYSSPTKMSVSDIKKKFAYAVDALANLREKIDITIMEAANSVHDVIALSDLYEKKGLALGVSFLGHYDEGEGLVLHDPVYGTISHLRAMEIITKNTGGYISEFGSNCGNDRTGYEKMLAKISGTQYEEKYTTIYPNGGEIPGCVDHGCEVVPYDDKGDRTASLLEKYKHLKTVGICCGNTVEENKKFVGELIKNGYTLANDFK